jgi:hypothetical protein
MAILKIRLRDISPPVFFIKNKPWSLDSYPKLVSNVNSNLLRYLNSKFILCVIPVMWNQFLC